MMENFYFTFGSSLQFPFQGGYLIVVANNVKDAIAKYREKYPDVHENCVNCAFIYNEEEWNSLSRKSNICHEIIK